MNGNLTKSEVALHIEYGGGVNLSLENFSAGNLLKWKEVHTIQLFVETCCGNPRPMINLSQRRSDIAYCDELQAKFNVVKDNPMQMMELAWTYEQRRTNHLKMTINNLKKEPATVKLNDENKRTKEFNIAVRNELANSKLKKFAYEANLVH